MWDPLGLKPSTVREPELGRLPSALTAKAESHGRALWIPTGGSKPRYGQAQRAQYPLIKEYTLNYKGIHIMI